MIDKSKKGLVKKMVRKEVKPVEKKQKIFSVKGRKGESLTLHEGKFYYFSKKVGKNAVAEKPADHKVKKTKNGYPYLVRV